MPSTDTTMEERFDERFAKISHLHRGECVITDSSGSKFMAHTENGKITEIGGLESIKDFIRSEISSAVAGERKRASKAINKALDKYGDYEEARKALALVISEIDNENT